MSPDKRNALSQTHMQDHREHMAHSLSQPPTAHPPYSQCDSPAAEQSSDNMTYIPTSLVQSTKLSIPPPPLCTEQWQTINRKRYRKTEDKEYPSAKKQTIGWVKQYLPATGLAPSRKKLTRMTVPTARLLIPHQYSYPE
jgi:hypothetical protein